MILSFSIKLSTVSASVARPGTSSLLATQTCASSSHSARTNSGFLDHNIPSLYGYIVFR